MANEEFKISLGAQLKSDTATTLNHQIDNLKIKKIKLTVDDTDFSNKIGNIQSQISRIQSNPVPIQLDDQRVLNQIANIRSQIQALGNIQINLGGGNTTAGVNNTVTGLQRATREIANLHKQIRNMELKLGNLKMSGADVGNIATYTTQLNTLRNTYENLLNTIGGQNVNLDAVFADINRSRTEMARLSSDMDNVRTRLAGSIKNDIGAGKLQEQIRSVENTFVDLNVQSAAVTGNITRLRALLVSMDSSDNIEVVTDDYRQFQQILKTTTNQVKELQRQQKASADAQKAIVDAQKLSNKKASLSSDIDVWLHKNSAAARDFGEKLRDIQNRLQACNAVELDKLKQEFKEVKREAEIAGKTGLNFVDRFNDQIKSLSTYLSAASLFSYASMALREMYDNVVEIDSAMTDLYKVTDETADRYDRFLTSAAKNSQKLSRSLSSYIEQTANWAKMDFSIEESEELAKLSSIYANVADVDDATAVSDMVTAMKAYNISASEAITIIDPLNKISNEFAVTAAGLGQGLSRSASTMSAAGTDMEHTLALLTGIAEITQSPEEAGNFLKTAVARIQGKLLYAHLL